MAAFWPAPFFFCRFGFIGSARFLFFCRLCLCRGRVRAPGRVLGGRFFWGSLCRRRQEITRRTVGFAALFCFLCAFGSLPLFSTASSGFAEIHTRISPLDRGLALCRGGFCMAKQRLFATGKTSDIKKEPIGFLLCFYCARPGRLCGAFPFAVSRCLPSYEKTTSARFCPANARIRPAAMRPTLKQSHARIDLLGNRPCANCFLRCLSRHGKIFFARTLPAAKPYPFYNRALFALCLCHTRRPSCFLQALPPYGVPVVCANPLI